MKERLLSILACPVCHEPVAFEGTTLDGRLQEGILRCQGCQRRYQVLDQMAILKERELSAHEWQWQVDVSDLEEFEALRKTYDDALPADVRAARAAIIEDVLDAIVPDSEIVLDIATGQGGLFRPLAERVTRGQRADSAADCLASDVDERVLRGTQRKVRQEDHGEAASFVVCDAKHLALQDDTVDAVVSFHGFANVPDGPAALKEASRVLRAGGLLVFSTLLLREDQPSFQMAAERGYADLLSEQRLIRALEGAGLRLGSEQVFVSGPWKECPYDLLPLAGDWFAHAVFTAHKPASMAQQE